VGSALATMDSGGASTGVAMGGSRSAGGGGGGQ
jgi:hypothetical protein